MVWIGSYGDRPQLSIFYTHLYQQSDHYYFINQFAYLLMNILAKNEHQMFHPKFIIQDLANLSASNYQT
jgi:hypothetical protein